MVSKSDLRAKRDEGTRSTKDNSKTSTNGAPSEHVISKELEERMEFYEECLREVFDRKRDFFIEAVSQRVRDSGLLGAATNITANESEGWVEVESLSKLRAVVGGRFQNIKQKWIEAGFPLREHRGDRGESFDFNKEGWLGLSHWINNQGFDTRLSTGKENCLFEIRARK